VVVLSLLLLATPAAAGFATAIVLNSDGSFTYYEVRGTELDELVQETVQVEVQLAALEPYVHYASDGTLIFDAQLARRDGFSESVVSLAEEIIAFQNDLAEIADGSSYFSIQYGEPNPEIHSYSWPYWYWGAYCFWWHQYGPGA